MPDSIHVFDPGYQVLDPATGDPSSGAKILFFDAGTTTPRTVYSDSGLTTSLGTTITCNSNGVPVNGSNAEVEIYTDNTAYKCEITTSADVTIYGPVDNIQGALDTSAFATAGSTQTYNRPVDIKSADYTVLAGDAGKVIPVNSTGGTFTITLPSAVTVGDGFTIGLRHVGTANQVRIATVSGQNIDIDGKNNVSAYSLRGIGHSIELSSDGSNWLVNNESLPFGEGLFTIVDRLATPPGSPTPAARYIVTSSPTGDWSTFSEHDIAEADGQGNWINYTPPTNAGWRAYVQDETTNYQFKSSAWVVDEGYLTVSTAGLRFVEKQTLSSVSEATFTSLSSDYFMYELLIDNLQPATDGDSLYFRTSADNGSSYDSGASDYGWLRGGRNVSAGALTGGSDADTEIQLFGATIGNAAGEGVSGIIRIYNPGGTGFTRITWEIYFRITTGSAHAVYGGGDRRAAAAVDAVRLFYNTGNIASGDITLVGYRGS